ncbi:MAG: TolC family outer membrane protein [Xanthomonadaceae bacterium]|nr:TolC family outer membrane protein [Xanthomonadaceae bacterium]
MRTLTVSLLGLGLALPAHAEDLLTVYQAAVENDPLIREALAERNALREARPQSLAGLLPGLEARGSREDTTRDGTQISLLPDNSLALVDFASDTEVTAYSLVLSQPIFRWDRWVALRQAGDRVAQAEINYEAARQQLIVRVAERYFNVLAAQDNLDFAAANKEAISRQLDQARRRFEVGLIAITDVQEAQAAYDTAVADEIAATRQLAAAREQLREITGDYYRNLAGPATDLALTPPEPANENAWVERALTDNLTLNAQRLSVDIARKEIGRVRAGHYPTIDLNASRGRREATGSNPFDTSNVDTEFLSLNVVVPIFSGGATQSRVRESAYRHEASKSALEREARATERTARDAYLGVQSDISRVRALRQALESNATALQATEAGFEVGTRTTVDVLNARSLTFRARNELARSRYDYLLNTLRLKQAAGALTERDVQQVNALLED